MWGEMMRVIKEETQKTIQKQKTKGTYDRADNQCKHELKQKKVVRQIYLQMGTEKARNKYQEQRRKTKKILRMKKRAHK